MGLVIGGLIGALVTDFIAGGTALTLPHTLLGALTLAGGMAAGAVAGDAIQQGLTSDSTLFGRGDIFGSDDSFYSGGALGSDSEEPLGGDTSEELEEEQSNLPEVTEAENVGGKADNEIAEPTKNVASQAVKGALVSQGEQTFSGGGFGFTKTLGG